MRKLIMVVALGISLSGCITCIDRGYDSAQAARGAGSKPKSIAYNLRRTTHAGIGVEFSRTDYTDTLLGGWAPPQTDALTLSLFRQAFGADAKAINPTIDSHGGDCDIMMDVMQQNSFNSLAPIGAFLSGLTFTLVPCWGDDMYTLYVEASDKSGLKKTYQVSRSVSTVTWLPFIFGLPFTGTPNARISEITLYNWKELRDRMEADGFFR